LKAARARGFSTAAIGKVGPTLIFDHTDRADRPGLHSVVIDDSTGGKTGVPLSDELKAALTTASLPLETPLARRQRQVGRCQDARHLGAKYRAAGLFRRYRQQGRAADVQGPQQAVRAGVLVARIPTAPSTITATASTA